ncbi:hypothetical protein GCM10018980_52600 [Streptomyces capoamus]|uniref:Uncharacterized protein n=1 Tax=Streptomyces capoamus TaxID=68183 RepID=A0A919EZN0_9ACTN|nr:hypothetical protein GCM10018980_52600 [Streptomyces capoamus]
MRPHRSLPHKGATVGAALLSTAAFLAVGLQAVPATAAPAAAHPSPLRAGGLAAKLSPAQHQALLKSARQHTATTARSLGLGAQEKLVVKDVVKDNDGTLHTRYERTYAGLPVLGGDLVVHTPPASLAKGTVSTTFNNKRTIKVRSTAATVSRAAATTKALKAAKTLHAKKPTTDSARKVIWAGTGTPKLAWETVIGGFQDDGTPSRLHVITDATTGKELHRFQAVDTGIGNTRYSGQVSLTTTQSGSTYTLNDGTRGGHKTYNLNHGTSGTGTLFSQSSDTWGDGTNSNAATAGADAHYGAAVTWDFYKNTFGRGDLGLLQEHLRPQRHPQRRRRRLLPRPLRQRLRERLLGRHLLLHDLRRRVGQQRPAHLAGRGRPRDEPRRHLEHRGPGVQR